MLLSNSNFFCALTFFGFHLTPVLAEVIDEGFCPVLLNLLQEKKVNFTVHAIVTTSDLEISPAQISFGYCTIYEAVQTNIRLTNKSLLPQEFGFVGLPEV